MASSGAKVLWQATTTYDLRVENCATKVRRTHDRGGRGRELVEQAFTPAPPNFKEMQLRNQAPSNAHVADGAAATIVRAVARRYAGPCGVVAEELAAVALTE